MLKRTPLLPFALAFGLIACGGKKEEVKEPVEQETSAQEILRLGNQWTNVTPDKGLLSPPSKISLFRIHRKSELRFSETLIVEKLLIEEEVQLRDGPIVKCSTEFEHNVGHRFGRHNGEPAVEIVRPALHAARKCDGIHPEGPIAEPARRALFVLRSDNLVAVEPKVDQRTYVPGQL
jgi:hypothetical protein